jgi:DNA-binding transcriptional ArsR family regulator
VDLEQEVNELHAGLCSALADPKRIMILYALAEKPRNVTDIAETLGHPQSTISRHLRVLRERGLVRTRRDGSAVVYTLVDQRLIEALDTLRAVLRDLVARRAEVAVALE